MGSMTAERFRQGQTYDEFKASMTRDRERFEANEARVRIAADDLAALKRARPLRVVALAADWCGDVIANLPVLGRIAQESGTLDVRVFERDANADLMDQYLNQGQWKSIPVFAFFDDGWSEVGVFIERPDPVTEIRARKRREVFAAHPEFGSPDAPPDQLPEDVRARLQAELQKMRDETTDWANGEVIREIRAIVEGRARWGGAKQREGGMAQRA
ncbi:MAG: thioredoxin family protein [Chloroflexi bacterium]|nr:thioredoxin family protein [Chloroflexota bacterium]